MVLQRNVGQVENPFRGKDVSQSSGPPAQRSQPQSEGHVEAVQTITGEEDLFPLPLLSFREMTGFEEEFIEAHGNEPNTAKLVNEVLARCLVKPGEEPTLERETIKNLLVADRDVALIRLRQTSIGDELSTETNCPHCGEANAIDFRLSHLPLDFKRPPKQLRIALPNGQVAILRLPTAGDQEALLEAGLTGDAQYRSWLLTRLLLKIGSNEGPFDLAFTRSLSMSVRTILETKLSEVIPALDLNMEVTCHACGSGFTVPFDVPTFFLPNSRNVAKT